MEKEIWKKISHDKSYCEVSNLGNIRKWLHSKSRYMERRLYIDNRGYARIFVLGKQQSVHRVVAKAFLADTYFEGGCVNHKNGVKHDNRVENLEWCTVKENNDHAMKYLDVQQPKPLVLVDYDNNIVAEFESGNSFRKSKTSVKDRFLILKSDYSLELFNKLMDEKKNRVRKKHMSHSHRKLSDETVIEIRKLKKYMGYNHSKIATIVCCNNATVDSIISGRTYVDITL